MTVDREQWIRFRWQRHGLDGRLSDESLDDLLALGVQGGRQAGAELSLLQRAGKIGDASAVDAISPRGPLVNLWSVRGAPHAHRITHLDFIRDALAPDASDEGGSRYVAAVDEVAEALRSVVKGRMSKADASSAVAAEVSKSLVSWCERCKATHVPDATFRAAGLRAQIVLGPEERRATMVYPKPRHRQHKVDDARLELVRTYLRVNGPSTRTLLREWLGGAEATVATWSQLTDQLVKVQIANKRYELPEELLDAVRQAPKASGVVLVPPNDPYLRQVDRPLLVPDSRQRQQIWKALSGPGALLVDGEVAGFWRYRGSERTLTVTAFTDLKPAQRGKVEKNAAQVAEANGDDQPKVVWD
jgi:hypothetical protein